MYGIRGSSSSFLTSLINSKMQCIHFNQQTSHKQPYSVKKIYTLVSYIFRVCFRCALWVLGCQPFFVYLALGMVPYSLFLNMVIPSFEIICLLYWRTSLRFVGKVMLKTWVRQKRTTHENFKSPQMPPGKINHLSCF